MLIFAIVGFAFLVGWLANIILGGGSRPENWGPLILASFVGSFVGGAIASIIGGEGFQLRPSGLIGSVIGAVIVLAIYNAVKNRSDA